MARSYGWVIVGARALMGCVAIGAMFSLAVFLPPMSQATCWSRPALAPALTIHFLTTAVLAIGWAAPTPRLRPAARWGVDPP